MEHMLDQCLLAYLFFSLKPLGWLTTFAFLINLMAQVSGSHSTSHLLDPLFIPELFLWCHLFVGFHRPLKKKQRYVSDGVRGPLL